MSETSTTKRFKGDIDLMQTKSRLNDAVYLIDWIEDNIDLNVVEKSALAVMASVVTYSKAEYDAEYPEVVLMLMNK